MEEQQERDRRKRAEEEAEVEAHRRKLNPEDERDEGKSDDTPDVEAHAKARRP
ncbi:MAG TPA: hypothetical protein VM785_10530 [Gaiellales bacterium]|nr:hypothetical protein [Gaiellales bacterium]